MTTEQLTQLRKPRCFLVYALAPSGLTARQANLLFNAYVADEGLPLVLFHDHFIGQVGGVAIFWADDAAARAALYENTHLADWHVEIRPLIYSYNAGAFDAQIAYTLSAYRNADWEALREEKRPPYGDLQEEANTAQESD